VKSKQINFTVKLRLILLDYDVLDCSYGIILLFDIYDYWLLCRVVWWVDKKTFGRALLPPSSTLKMTLRNGCMQPPNYTVHQPRKSPVLFGV
jgi:hypothetical protein